MARIRSIHPGLFTDEVYMAMSPLAKAAWPGIWTECDDHGVFEWKPIVLKARLLPADTVDLEALLEELVGKGAIRKFEDGGKWYGTVRNFCLFQKPKKPIYRHPLPNQFRTFVGLNKPSGEPVPHQCGTGGEVSLLMEKEEGEGGKEEEKKEREDSGPKRAVSGRYVFEAGIIRLSKKDFDAWEKAFSNLNLRAELTSLAGWAGKTEQAGNWFHAVSGALGKRDREAKRALDLAKSTPAKSPQLTWDPGL